ncbi:RICIN domain-containing protein [Bacillus tropicus]|uniref:RICIN domain-containing protein n=1 Tax=Bacillus tropicus TaxID=2026188 RepID=UPI003D1A6040
MKSISKKVIAGLLVGATSLSVWAPSSEAATLEKNQYYSIHLNNNLEKVWNVSAESTGDDRAILLYNGKRGDNEQFVFFQLDDGAYAIVNKNSGKTVSVGPRAWFGTATANRVMSGESLLQRSWTGGSAEKWNLRNQGSNKYEIVNQGNGKVASYKWEGSLVDNVEYAELAESNPSDPNKVFNISKNPFGLENFSVPGLPNLEYNTFSMPNLPATGTRPNAPDYNQAGPIDQQLPQTSESVVVGASLIPCIMVKDNNASDYTKIHNSPYYTLVKEEYWEKVRSEIIPAGSTSKYTIRSGVSTVDQQKMTDTLSMNFGADLGLKFGQQSANLKASITKTLQTEVSKTSTDSKEETEEKTIAGVPGKNTGFTAYQLVTKYTLKRTDGSVVSDSWSVRDKNQTLLRTIPNN